MYGVSPSTSPYGFGIRVINKYTIPIYKWYEYNEWIRIRKKGASPYGFGIRVIMMYYICMELFTKGNTLHHAYCIIGDSEKIILDLQKILKKEFDFLISENPDFWYGKYDILDIEDSRKLKEIHQNKPTVHNKKVFVVSTNFITEKAQNAMLKLFEEPSGQTHFFLIMPSAQNIIPTLRSRMIILEHDLCHPVDRPNFLTSKASVENGSTLVVERDPGNRGWIPASAGMTEGRKFLKASIKERMEMIKELINSVSHEKNKGLLVNDEEKSKIEVVKLINSIEKEFLLRQSALCPVASSAVVLGSSLRQSASLLENIEKVRQYASDGSPSLKMLLEYLAIIL